MISSRQFKEIIRDIIREELGTGKNYKIGTIANVNGKPTIQFAGEDQPSQKKYSFLDSYTPVEGDRVLLASVSGTYVVIGKIQQDKGLQLENEYIVESGTNENGEYVRYASGIQICWCNPVPANTSTLTEGIYHSDIIRVDYPAIFARFIGVIVNSNGTLRWADITGTPSLSYCSVRQFSISRYTTTQDIRVMAIGWWK